MMRAIRRSQDGAAGTAEGKRRPSPVSIPQASLSRAALLHCRGRGSSLTPLGWRSFAEIANEYLSKGKQVYVEGRLRQVEYTDRDGNRRTALEVTASDIQFLGTKSEGGDEKSKAEPRATSRAQAESDVVNDDEIPF